MKKVILLSLFSALILIEGCAPSQKSESEKIIPVERIMRKIEAKRRTIKSFYGSGILEIKSEKLEAKANFEVLIRKPDSIKISVIAPLGFDLGELLVTSEGFVYYDALKNRLIEGTDKDRVIKNIFKLDISFSNLLDAFAGSINLTEQLNEYPQNVIENKNGYIFDYKTGNTIARYIINPQSLNIYEYNILNSKLSKIVTSEFKSFGKVNSTEFPYKIILSELRSNQKVIFDYREIRINEIEEPLKIYYPKDAKRIKWD